MPSPLQLHSSVGVICRGQDLWQMHGASGTIVAIPQDNNRHLMLSPQNSCTATSEVEWSACTLAHTGILKLHAEFNYRDILIATFFDNHRKGKLPKLTVTAIR